MKRFLSFLTAASLVLGFAACSEKEELTEGGNTEFPTSQEYFIGTDGTTAVTAKSNVAWTVTLTGDESNLFALYEYEQEVGSVSGAANEEKTFTVAYMGSDFTNDHSATLTMNAGGKSQVIGTVKLSGTTNVFNLYAVEFDEDGEILDDDEGMFGWKYNLVAPGEEILLHYRSTYDHPIAVEANFEWQLTQHPEWLEAPEGTYNSEYGRTSYLLSADPEKFPLDGDSANLVFASVADPDRTYTYVVTIPAAKEYFNLYNFAEQAEFNAEGLYYRNGSWLEMPTFGYADAAGTPVIVTFEKLGDNNYTVGAEWIKVTSEDDSLFDNSVIRTYRYEITVDENTGAAREGMVAIIPEYIYNDLTAGDLEGGMLESQFIATYVSQAAPEVKLESDITLAIGQSEITFFKPIEKQSWWPFSNDLQFYELAYIDQYSHEDGTLNISEKYQGEITFRLYDADAEEFDETTEAFNGLSTWVNGAGSSFKISMDFENAKWKGWDYEHEGFVEVLSNGTPFAVIYCIYDENNYKPEDGNNSGDSGSYEVSWTWPDYVGDNAMLVKIEDDPTTYLDTFNIPEVQYNNFKAQGIKMYGLALMSENTYMTALTISGINENYNIFVDSDWLSVELGMNGSDWYIMPSLDNRGDEKFNAIRIYTPDWEPVCVIYFAYMGE